MTRPSIYTKAIPALSIILPLLTSFSEEVTLTERRLTSVSASEQRINVIIILNHLVMDECLYMSSIGCRYCLSILFRRNRKLYFLPRCKISISACNIIAVTIKNLLISWEDCSDDLQRQLYLIKNMDK